ncbi:MAG: hypothetical protein WCT01_04740, partial [Candidatus Shapirobacteria bacterium]
KQGQEILAKPDVKKDEFDKFNQELVSIVQTISAALYQSGQPSDTPQEDQSNPPKSEPKKDKPEAEEGEVV